MTKEKALAEWKRIQKETEPDLPILTQMLYERVYEMTYDAIYEEGSSYTYNIAYEEGVAQGRKNAVQYIREHFNNEEYAKMWPEQEDLTDEEEKAAFWMWFNPLLQAAENPKT